MIIDDITDIYVSLKILKISNFLKVNYWIRILIDDYWILELGSHELIEIELKIKRNGPKIIENSIS